MPRGKAKGRASKKGLTPKQQDIVELMTKQPGITAGEIADALGVSDGSIYQQQSRLRSAGLLPKGSSANGRSRTVRTTTQSAPARKAEPDFDEMVPPLSNGSLTLEEHVERDTETTVQRLTEVEATIRTLEGERSELTERQKRLGKVKAALAA